MTPLALGALTATLALMVLPSTAPVGSGRAGGPAPVSAPAPVALGHGTWPVEPAVVVGDFDETLPYGPGHRGVDLAAPTGRVVVAAGRGTVTTAGTVAGRPVVVVDHGSGIRTTYLPVRPWVEVGDRVRPGDPLGVLAPSTHCPETCLHWGARAGDTYIDPRSLLPSWEGTIVLLPLDG